MRDGVYGNLTVNVEKTKKFSSTSSIITYFLRFIFPNLDETKEIRVILYYCLSRDSLNKILYLNILGSEGREVGVGA